MRTEIVFGTAAAFALEGGDSIVIGVGHGRQAGDLSFPGFDQALSRDINGISHFGRPVLPYHATPGMHLYDGEGEPIMVVGPITGEGGNDIMLPGCRREIYEDGRLGCRDLIAAALDLERAELTGMLSFFAIGVAGESFFDGLAGTSAAPGASCSFSALRPVTMAVSACPGTDIPGFQPGNLIVEVTGS